MNALPNVFDLPAPEPEDRPEGQLARTRTESVGRSEFDRFLEDFISGREPQTTQWIRLASLVASQSFSCDVVIRVLRPNEKVASGTLPIDKLGVSIARKVGAKYSPGRLKRAAVRMEDFGFDPDEGGGSAEKFSFDKSFLPATARVLVIGDHEAPAPTIEAIRKSVEAQLPNAEVKSFTLHWLEEHFRTAPLDDRYFLSSESPLSVLSRQANPHRPEVPQEPVIVAPDMIVAPAVPDAPSQLAETPVGAVAATTQEAPAHPLAAPRPKAKKPTQLAAKKSRFPSWAGLVALGIIVLGVGLVVVADKRGMFSAKFEGADASVIPEPTEAPLAEPPTVQTAPAASAPAVEAKPKGPQGIITVPSAGLRSGPSLDSKPLRRSVRGNERVTILRRKPSNAGPDWVQVQTKSGAVGWVWSSVVREGRPR